MIRFTTFPILFLIFMLLSCNKNDPKENEILNSISEQPNENNWNTTEKKSVPSTSSAKKILTPPTKSHTKSPSITTNKTSEAKLEEKESILASKAIKTPLIELLKNGQIGKTYTKEELKKEFHFTDESLKLIKSLTLKNNTTLDFKWKSTWFVESVSDAKFKNGPMTFNFHPRQISIKGGAIGIKYKKKVYTDLIIKNGKIYIPSVKGFYWEVRK